MKQYTKGFTIVELLIVIVVIGILAAIVIVAFNGVQSRGHDASIRTDLVNIAKKLESYKILSSDDKYPASLDDASLGAKVSTAAYGNHHVSSGLNHNLLYCLDNAATRTAYAVIARSKSGTTFAVTNTNGTRSISTALTASATSCPDQGMTTSGVWWGLNQSVWRVAG